MSASGNTLAAACVRMEYQIKELKAENMRLKLRLIFIEEWFDNIFPVDWDLCMRRWEER